MLSGRSVDRSPSGIWVCQCPGSRRHCAGATTPTTTPTSSRQAATGGSAPGRTELSPSTRAACRTGAASPAMWMPLSGTSMVRSKEQQPDKWTKSSCWGLKSYVSCHGILTNKTLRLIIYTPIPHCVFYLSGYAHFIQGRKYWKFDPVGMNSLEGYPRYIGVDFFGCRNVWVSNLWRIRLSFFFFLLVLLLFWQWRGIFFGTETFVCSRGMRQSPFKSGYALLHLLILRSVTPSSQEKPRYVSSDLAPPVQLYSYLFCTFVTTRLRSGPCIFDVWCWCEPHRSHLLSLSLKLSFFLPILVHRQNQYWLSHSL